MMSIKVLSIKTGQLVDKYKGSVTGAAMFCESIKSRYTHKEVRFEIK